MENENLGTKKINLAIEKYLEYRSTVSKLRFSHFLALLKDCRVEIFVK
jgi:hypothetical protein